jgi:hypothetical protein
METFFREEASTDQPYRQLILDSDESGKWRVRLLGGQKAKAVNVAVNVLSEESVASFEAGERRCTEIRGALQREGWRVYRPQYGP